MSILVTAILTDGDEALAGMTVARVHTIIQFLLSHNTYVSNTYTTNTTIKDTMQ